MRAARAPSQSSAAAYKTLRDCLRPGSESLAALDRFFTGLQFPHPEVTLGEARGTLMRLFGIAVTARDFMDVTFAPAAFMEIVCLLDAPIATAMIPDQANWHLNILTTLGAVSERVMVARRDMAALAKTATLLGGGRASAPAG